MKCPNDNFWDGCGLALIILAILLGMGGCGALWNLTEQQPVNTTKVPQ